MGWLAVGRLAVWLQDRWEEVTVIRASVVLQAPLVQLLVLAILLVRAACSPHTSVQREEHL